MVVQITIWTRHGPKLSSLQEPDVALKVKGHVSIKGAFDFGLVGYILRGLCEDQRMAV